MDALGSISWTTINILRVGHESEEPSSTEEHPVTVGVSLLELNSSARPSQARLQSHLWASQW